MKSFQKVLIFLRLWWLMLLFLIVLFKKVTPANLSKGEAENVILITPVNYSHTTTSSAFIFCQRP